MSIKGFPRLQRVLRFASDKHLKETLGWVVALVAAGLGITYLFPSASLTGSITYSVAFSLAVPGFYGGMMLVAAVILAMTLIWNRAHTMWPSLGISLVFGFITLTNLLSIGMGGVPTAIWLNLLMAMVAALLTAAFSINEER